MKICLWLSLPLISDMQANIVSKCKTRFKWKADMNDESGIGEVLQHVQPSILYFLNLCHYYLFLNFNTPLFY